MVDFTNDAAWNCVQEDNDNSLAAREKHDDEYLQQCKANEMLGKYKEVINPCKHSNLELQYVCEECGYREESEAYLQAYEKLRICEQENILLKLNLETIAKHITGQNQKVPEQNRAIALAFEVLGSEHIK